MLIPIRYFFEFFDNKWKNKQLNSVMLLMTKPLHIYKVNRKVIRIKKMCCLEISKTKSRALVRIMKHLALKYNKLDLVGNDTRSWGLMSLHFQELPFI